MSEFKISRFKHTWQDGWNPSTVYNPDDIVVVGGKVYNCLVRHTSDANFYVDLNYVNNDIPPVATPKWELMSDGVSWQGNWQPSTYYNVGDIVKFGGSNYICLFDHTSVASASNFSDDYITNSRWAVTNSSTSWENTWAPSTFYSVDSIVKYSGNLYKCINSHTSTSDPSQLVSDIVNWQLYLYGTHWRSNWATDTLYYVDDIVAYGGIVYKCIGQHVSAATTAAGLELNEPSWAILFSGVLYRGNWAAAQRYRVNDIVKYGGFTYICTVYHTSLTSFNVNNWQIFCPGQEYEIIWNASTVYNPGDIVANGGYLFVATTTNVNSRPTFDQQATNSNWNLLFEGTKVRGDWSVTATYLTGDLVRRNGQLYVAKQNLSPGTDVDTIGDGSSINEPYWDLFIPGTNWTGGWISAVTYFIGDLVSWRGGAYVCVQKHIANGDNRPDQDIINAYWISYTYGDPTNVLSFAGDLKTFGIQEDGSTVGAKNLLVGTEEQTLRAGTEEIEWTNFNESAKTYYVSLQGKDGEDRGTTLNASWRTIRYALENITGPATVFVKTGYFEEILPLSIPANVAVVGDELRGTVIAPAVNWYSSTDISAYRTMILHLSLILPLVVRNNEIGTLDSNSPAFGTTKYAMVNQDLTGTPTSILEVTTIQTLLETIDDYTDTGLGNTIVGTNNLSVDADKLAAASRLTANIPFIISQVKGYVDTVLPSYNYTEWQLEVDITRLVKAIAYDLRYPGNFKSANLGKYFYYGSNPTTNKKSNMFLLRDSTGLRNCTLVGLEGQLGNLNIYLTRRPDAGAYASLDPGWGTTDSTVWITDRSPYVQNVTTFGSGCLGLKIDGTLHVGGNKTIVANDFTQILSDGIGVWANGDGKTEVVSIFTYYNHVGYLSTNGGKIRGTNGNCSYGEYGAVAEGFDLTETPITATVNNRFYDATVNQAFTVNGEIVKLFFDHAGEQYTSATFTASGSGIGASFLADEFRNFSISQARLLDPGDSSTPGGSGYTLALNAAQAGDLTTITLAASDDKTAAEYTGLRIVIATGTGAGQYGYIADYDSAGKVVYVAKEFYYNAGHTDVVGYRATNTTTGTNLITLTSVNGLVVNDPILFTGTVFGNIAVKTIYYVKTISGSQITISTTPGGGTFSLVTASGANMYLHKAGWEHFQAGRQIESVLDTTTGYSIEPRVIIDHPPLQINSRNIPLSSTWKTAAYGGGTWVMLADGNGNGSTASAYSSDSVSWTSGLIANGAWNDIAYGNSTFVAIAKDGKAATSPDGIIWTLRTIPAGEYTSIAFGNNTFVAVSSGGTQVARSTNNGVSWTSEQLPEGADWSSVAFGKGIFVAVAQSDSSVTQTAYSTNNGVTWVSGSFAGGCKSLAYGNNRFVAIAGGYSGAQNTFISFDGITWTSGQLPYSANWQSVSYGQGQFLAIANTQSRAAYSYDGVNWKTIDLTFADSFVDVVNGSVSGYSTFIVIASGSNTAESVRLGARALARVNLSSNRITTINFWETGSNYIAAPSISVVDPNNSSNAVAELRINNGVLGNPSIVNAGAGYTNTTTNVAVIGDGFTDLFQIGRLFIIDGAQRIPGPGDNLSVAGIDDYVYKILEADVLSGSPGNYRLRLSIAKNMGVAESPTHGTSVTIRQNYSQVRLTNHDFLDIGLGNFVQTNYPNTLFPVGTVLAPEDEIREQGGGRVFYTSTDQDGNFRCGELFAVEQATGTVTISADFFQLEGLEELALGGVTVGGSGVVIREFSTDPFFVADSNNIVPTQKAIKEYLARRISGGGADAFTGQFTAGVIRVGPSAITTTTGDRIEIPATVKFNGPLNGAMLYYTYFLAGEID